MKWKSVEGKLVAKAYDPGIAQTMLEAGDTGPLLDYISDAGLDVQETLRRLWMQSNHRFNAATREHNREWDGLEVRRTEMTASGTQATPAYDALRAEYADLHRRRMVSRAQKDLLRQTHDRAAAEASRLAGTVPRALVRNRANAVAIVESLAQ